MVDGAVASASRSAQISTADDAGAAFTCTVSEKQTQTTLTRGCAAATLAIYPPILAAANNPEHPIHRPSALYEAFEPAEALRIARKLEFHFTPKHGSWLNMTEIEFSILSRQALDQRIPDVPTLTQVVEGWEAQRNAEQATIHDSLAFYT